VVIFVFGRSKKMAIKIQKAILITFFLGACFFAQDFRAQGEMNKNMAVQLTVPKDGGFSLLKELPRWLKPSSYRYDPVGKVDPFVPFINLQALSVRKKKPKSNSPLANLEVTQLRLVGILWDPKDPERARAMVELPDGKGFILKLGMIIGRNDGKVIKITPDSVLIEEEMEDIFGKISKRQIVLKLHPKKGEE